MTELPQQLINWLYNVLQPQYLHKQVVYTHVIQFLQQTFSKGFRIRTRVYTSGVTGNANLLINLYGSISLGNNINVPIEIWIPLNYPFSQSNLADDVNGVPLIFVVPNNANGVFLSPGNFVDSQGKFYHPYLAEWYQCQDSSDLNAISQFNLLNMFNLVVNLFEKNCPIYLSSPSNTPVLPPKPHKVPISIPGQSDRQSSQKSYPNTQVQAAQRSGLDMSPQTTGPPLPAKPQKSPTVPLKYQAPLPLPDERSESIQSSSALEYPISPQSQHAQTENRYGIIHPHQTNFNSPSPPGYYSSPPPAQSPPPRNSFAEANSRTQSTIDSLMDQDDRSNALPTNQNRDKHVALVKLSEEINKCLQCIPENSSVIETINTNTLKIDGLYNQLNHHNNQAMANKDNLHSHLNYLTDQLTQITNLNNQLDQLQQLNEKDESQVHYGYNNKVRLDDLIIPDLVLTNQLYDITSDIKSSKDVVALISGEFNNESEIINNENFDPCIKSVRNIGRELFWLELLKSEISKKMSVS